MGALTGDLPNGTPSAPSLAFQAQPTSGYYWDIGGVDGQAWSANGTTCLKLLPTSFTQKVPYNLDGSAVNPSYSFTNDTSTGMYRDQSGSGNLGLTVGGNEIMKIAPSLVTSNLSPQEPIGSPVAHSVAQVLALQEISPHLPTHSM